MCCYDWGATHPVGYLKSEAFSNESEYDKIVSKAKKGAKGFELLENVEKSKIFNKPLEKVQTLSEIWYGKEINHVREKHVNSKIDDIEICKGCAFKDTYEWVSAN